MIFKEIDTKAKATVITQWLIFHVLVDRLVLPHKPG